MQKVDKSYFNINVFWKIILLLASFPCFMYNLVKKQNKKTNKIFKNFMWRVEVAHLLPIILN